MRLRIILLVVAISSMVLVSFLVPLALVLRTLAADRAVSTATVQAQWVAPLVATLDTSSLRLAVDQVNAENKGAPVTVFLPGGKRLGGPAPRNAPVLLASQGRSFTTQVAGGVEVLVAVQGLPHGTAVIRTFVPDRQLQRGVERAWLLLGCVGLGLLLVAAVVADLLARSLVRPVRALASASERLATGDLTARAQVAGPPEVRKAGTGLNRLAARIGELLARERETVADLSHQLRTPLTALRIDAESLRGGADASQLIGDVDAVERTVNEIIRTARRPTADPSWRACEANQVVGQRAAFWQPLAEDTERPMSVELMPGPAMVRASGEELAACVDILLGNVFAHTPDGVAFAVRVRQRAGGGAWLVVSDDGPGFPSSAARRGLSSAGSTGLGLDIARRVAAESGGTLTIGRSPSGGGSVTVGLGPPPGTGRRDQGQRHRRGRLRRDRAAARVRRGARDAERPERPRLTSP
jgi:signal transduction histidine kinase